MKNRFILFFVIFFFAGCSWQTETILHTSLTKKVSQKPCINNITRYYMELKEGKYKKMYHEELPSFRYFYDYKTYQAYYKGFKKFDTIDIVGIKKMDNNIFETKIRFYRKDHPLFTIKEKWVQMNGKCYHYLYDPFIFNK